MIAKNKFTLTKEERKTLIYNGIQFRSPLEIRTYKRLVFYNINFTYEDISYSVFPKFIYSGGQWQKDAQGVFKELRTKIIQPITHKPDFHIYNKDKVLIAIIETKGIKYADFVLRKKMLLKWLEDNGTPVPYYMPSDDPQVEECIKMIKNYE